MSASARVDPAREHRLAREADWQRMFSELRDCVRSRTTHVVSGRLTRVAGLVMEASGLRLPIGSVCLVAPEGAAPLEAEVVGFADDRLYLMPLAETVGVRPGARIVPIDDPVQPSRLLRPAHPWRRAEDRSRWLPSGDALLGRVVDAVGRPLDGLGPLGACKQAPVNRRPINAMDREPIREPLDTGVRAINALLTVGRGQRLGLFAGSGVGKSVLLEQAVEDERAAIAREIHDDVGGMLTALRFDLAWIERHDDARVRARARQGLETLNQAVLAVQRIMRNLRPPALDAGIVAALDFLVAQFASRTGIAARLTANRDRIDLSEQVAITVYRVAQESLTNVAKHARAHRARVDLVVQDETLSLEVSDDGVGIRPEDIDKPGSFGLRGLTERVRQVHGWLDVAVGERRGAVMMTIPLTPRAAARLEEGLDG